METEQTIKLKEFREKAGLTLNGLSAESGLSTDYIWKIETGRVTNVGLDKLKLLASALNISLMELIGGQGVAHD